jgi:hypothetical protein
LECFLASSSRSSENNSLKVKKIEWQETGAWGEEGRVDLGILASDKMIILNRQFDGAIESSWKFQF